MRLEKYHGDGNDFLLLLDARGTQAVDAELARRACERHTGVGADGFIHLTREDHSVRLELRNADGGPAETSGNGLRCVARALIDVGWEAGPSIDVVTAAGPRRVTVEAGGQVRVDMGPAKVVIDGEVAHVDMGNPHLVVRAMPAALDPDVNTELITPGPEADTLTMRVWERGVGETLACGTGACAAAVAAHEWGLVGTAVTVRQPGGDALVELEPDTIFLTGPAVHVATVEWLEGDK